MRPRGIVHSRITQKPQEDELTFFYRADILLEVVAHYKKLKLVRLNDPKVYEEFLPPIAC